LTLSRHFDHCVARKEKSQDRIGASANFLSAVFIEDKKVFDIEAEQRKEVFKEVCFENVARQNKIKTIFS
jgi:hypothetical protein